MDQGTNGNLGERHAVARLDVNVLGAGDDGVTNVQALGAQDVGLGAVDVVQQGDASGAVGGVTGCDAAVVVAAGLLGQGLQEGLLGLAAGDLSEVGDGLETPTSARGLEVLDCH